jgi:predicted TIM-barrel fold metal-dependent hydrolase
MNKTNFGEAIRALPIIDSHTHFERSIDTHGYNMPRFLYFSGYANVYAGYLPPRVQALLDDPSGDEEEQFDALLQTAHILRHNRCGALIHDIARRMGAPLEKGMFKTLRRLYSARDESGIRRQTPHVKASICNSIGHPLYGDVAGLKAYLDGTAPPPDEGMYRLLTVTGLHSIYDREAMQTLGRVAGVDITTLRRWQEAVQTIVSAFVDRGIVGFKELYLYFRPNEIDKPNEAAARHSFDAMMKGEAADVALMDYLMYKTYEMIEDAGLPVQVHTGSVILGAESSTKMLSMQHFISDFPRIAFDLLHLNYPKLEDYFVLLRSCPNTYGNCTWVSSVDRNYTGEYLRRAADIMPVDRTIYLGTDRHCAGEPVAAVVEASLHILEETLWQMVEHRDFSADDALEIARLWLYENPKRLFRLPL